MESSILVKDKQFENCIECLDALISCTNLSMNSTCLTLSELKTDIWNAIISAYGMRSAIWIANKPPSLSYFDKIVEWTFLVHVREFHSTKLVWIELLYIDINFSNCLNIWFVCVCVAWVQVCVCALHHLIAWKM